LAPEENEGNTQDRAIVNSTRKWAGCHLGLAILLVFVILLVGVSDITTRLPLISAYPSIGAVGQRANERHRRSRLTSVRKTAISMAVIDEKSFTRECIIRCLQALDDRFNIAAFATCDECLQKLEGNDLVLYHVHEDILRLDVNNHKILSLKRLFNMVPVIIMSDIENPDYLIDILENGARGFIPTENTTPEQIIEIIEFVKAGGIFVPVSSLSLRRSNRQAATARSVLRSQFSPSEMAVLDRLKLGKANKIIAHELGLSESTVKVHIGRIMKKLKVTNRTQVVSRAYALATGGSQSSGEV
jgi:DNA-binding NarL/FixJ family response regulator